MIEINDKIIHSVLADINLEDGNLALQDLICYLSGDWHTSVPSQPDVERAVDYCMSMGWIKVLTETDCEEDRVRWLDNPHQNWTEGGLYKPGHVDMTAAGWDVYVKLTEVLYKRRLEDMHRKHIRYLWRTPGRVSALSMSQELLTKEKEAILSGSDDLTCDEFKAEHTFGEIIGPYGIGPWWVTRFYLAPSGYRLDVEFEPADMNF